MLFHKSFQPVQGHYLRTHNQAAALVRAGGEVTLLCWDRECKYPREEVRDGISIRRYWIRAGDFQGPRNFLRVLRYNWAVLWNLLRTDSDLIVSYSMDAMLTGLIVSKLRGKKCVLDLCEPEYYAFWSKRYALIRRMIRWLERGCGKRYDHLTVHNLYQIRKFQGYGIEHVTRIGSYPNQSLLPRSSRLPRPARRVVIGRLGSIYENNAIEEFLEGFRLLVDRQKTAEHPIEYQFILAGRVLPSYGKTFNRLIQPFGDHVSFHGAFEPTDLPELYGKIDISAILYLRRTAWFEHITPTKLFESLASGVPVLASDMGDVREIVESGECGVVVDEEDPESICRGLEEIVTRAGMWDRMAGNAIRLAKKAYTWEAQEDTFLDVYRGLHPGKWRETNESI